MQQARDRLAGAHRALASGDHSIAASAAYYAMLYAARAALSERDLHSKTHGGVWSLFSRTFVAPSTFDRDVFRQATTAQQIRELGDYEAKPPSPEQATELIDAAEHFLGAIDSLVE